MSERPIDSQSEERQAPGTLLETGPKSPDNVAASSTTSTAASSATRTRRADENRLAAILTAPVRRRELLAIFLLVVVSDLIIYRGYGFAGYAALFVVTPLLLLMGSPQPRRSLAAVVVACMLLVLAAKLVWLGSALLAVAGFVLLAAFAMALAGLPPYVLDVFAYAAQSSFAGMLGLARYWEATDGFSLPKPRSEWLKVVLPAAAVFCFGSLFILANPEIATALGERIRWFFEFLSERMRRFAPTWPEFFLWLFVAVFSAGLLRPVMKHSVFAELEKPPVDDDARVLFDAPLYLPFRNTLVALIVLFAAYLVFEFKTLWLRVFPEGFYYAGYAHEGAAWLTVALGLATVVLSAIFREEIFYDPRLPQLRRLAWTWSALNLLLAAAVYHRLLIYIDFNGMTRMRTIGLLGISAVVAGFVLVVWKIIHRRDFLWLLRRQSWALAIAVFLYGVLPVDYLIHTYNVRRILQGDLAPVVQISVHKVGADGILVLPPLVHSDDEIIREGIRALLARHAGKVEVRETQRRQEDWSSFQFADRLLHKKLAEVRPEWEMYGDAEAREAALTRFHEYVYQWY
jgi:hypothetical protein